MIEEIKQRLLTLSTPTMRVFSTKLITNSLPILGCKIPDLRKLAKEISKSDYLCFFEEYDASSYELQLVYAYVLCYIDISIKERIERLRSFVPSIRDWSVCDGLVCSLKCTKKYPKEMFDYILEYQQSTQEFEVRFLTEMLMVYYLNSNYIEQAIKIILSVHIDTYYAKMGVAWFIATVMVKNSSLAYKLLNEIKDPITITMAIQKIRDSYRVSAEDKKRVLFYKN